jgi:hypothetical protein
MHLEVHKKGEQLRGCKEARREGRTQNKNKTKQN